MRFSSGCRRPVLCAVVFVLLITAMGLQLAFSARRESQTFDEANHIFSGYRSWTHADFGLNPEHPPLIKLWAALPLLRLPLHVPAVQNRRFKVEAFAGGSDLLYKNDADRVLFRARMAVATLTLILAFLVFAAAREMFGAGAAFVALSLFVFDPNILAHGALVTTDMGVTCFLFAAVFAFYRYVRHPSWIKLAAVGLTAGASLAAKHSGLLVFPILLLLAATEIIRRSQDAKSASHSGPANGSRPQSAGSTPEADPATRKSAEGQGDTLVAADASGSAGGASRLRRVLLMGGALCLIALFAFTALWSTYAFRYAARPSALKMNPAFQQFAAGLQRSHEVAGLAALARFHVLPEGYLYGLIDVRRNADLTPSYCFGTLYPHGRWFYFPAVVLIKSTLGFLAMLVVMAPIGFAIQRRSGAVLPWREICFVLIPPLVLFSAGVLSGMNRGVRHILPIYPFLFVAAAAGAWALARRSRMWTCLVAALLLLHLGSSLHRFPSYIPYANEAWGGPANAYKYLTDSNVDWGQQLKSTQRFLQDRDINDCWFAYYAGEVADAKYYGIPCRPLPTMGIFLTGAQPEPVPARITGTVLVSSSLLSGFEFEGGESNPYRQFQRVRPVATIEHGIFVYEGTFDTSGVAALNHAARSWQLGSENRRQEALAEAQAAVALEPRIVMMRACLGDALHDLEKRDEARKEYQHALDLALAVEPEFHEGWLPYLRGRLAEK